MMLVLSFPQVKIRLIKQKLVGFFNIPLEYLYVSVLANKSNPIL